MTTAVGSEKQPEVLDLDGDRLLPSSPMPLIMGVLNLTPDSFSDGGRFPTTREAVSCAERLVAEGADILDIGAESTRPGGGVYGLGAETVPPDEELKRLRPVLSALRRRVSVPISVDTRKAQVARWAIEAGASIINDISALGDPAMADLLAESDCAVVLMHSRGALATMQRDIRFSNLIEDIRADLGASIRKAISAGIDENRIIIDPGIGFGKTGPQNLELLRRLDELQTLRRPILVGASRKSFIAEIDGSPVEQRLAGSLAAAGWAANRGASIIRVHDVRATKQYFQTWRAIETSAGGTA